MKSRITQDLKQALLSQDALRVSTLRMLLAAMVNKGKEKRYQIAKENPELSEEKLAKQSELEDQELLEVVMSEVKKRRESIEAFEKGGRKDLVAKEQAELKVLQAYLPEQLSEDEIKKLVQEVVQTSGARDLQDMGKVMAVVMPKVKGRADGALVSKIVKELLAH